MTRVRGAAVLLALLASPAVGVDVAPAWTARWISVPGAPAFDYGVYHFRRTFDLVEKPQTFLVHVTADNRYQLFANGARVSWGPARGDLHHWRYETVDLAPHLKAGRNVLAAVVWNFGVHAPQAQVTYQTGFLLQVAGEPEKALSTDRNWKAIRDEAYAPVPIVPAEIHNQYYVAGPGDRVDAAVYPWGWEQPDFDDAKWEPAQQGPVGSVRDALDAPSRWMLVPRSIPAMEETPIRFARTRRATGLTVPPRFPHAREPLVIPARSKAMVLLDQDHLTTAYPELTVTGGRGAQVSLRYAEALLEPGRKVKGNRDDVEGKEVRGARDVFIADGGSQRRFRPLWWRTYRYVQLEVETAEEPLTIDDLSAVATSYPFTARARLDAGEPELDRILEVGWRTARLCAHESYMDCPYYEQLQYAGDTRIQALVSLYMTGDGRLMRNAIAQLDDSRTSEGLTQSRAPTRLQQYIPPFSLWWIGMVHDYWRYQDDPAFVRGMLPGVRSVLGFFADRQTADGSLGPLPWWNFVDWARAWPRGVPPVLDGASAPLDLQLLLAYGYAADLEQAVGSAARAGELSESAARLRATIRQRYWDTGRGLFADTPARTQFSQHANVLAVLAGVVEGAEARAVMERVLSDTTLVPASIYFRHYLHAALNRSGQGDRYLELLGPWRRMLAEGLTTWAETNEPDVRSDCHAWGASPNFELFRTVLGIDSAAPGFRRVIVRPFLGRLTRASGAIPHPRGEIAVSLARTAAGLEAEIRLPEGVEGELVWGDARRPLPSGRSRLTLPTPSR
ncbi:MAG TPA: family 78 glycoside hydrolase catalytic domain [Vicinamibacteria bacterium]|nr:family 78 glycoside hydrolase catalytic domain [Vicinamibacteria bacterium]